ncbi:MAG: hypothetical protein K8S20_04135 [Chloroflexi bacterium]|nr:hypothetical protein [Chloroflexota bacterium]
MTLTSKPLALIVLVMLLGGIAFSSSMGWWTTESSKQPATFEEGEFAGQANPADIRGSYTFGDIAGSFAVTPEVLAQAFGVTGEDSSAFAIKELEAIYLESGYEIGTASVRLFVAYYTGLPFETADQDIYLPRSATDILLSLGDLTPEQIGYLEKYTIPTGITAATLEPAVGLSPLPVDSSAPASTEYSVKGKTTFGELLSWGVSLEIIEGIIGAPMPDPAMTVKDFASAGGLDFETLRPALQMEVDKVKP